MKVYTHLRQAAEAMAKDRSFAPRKERDVQSNLYHCIAAIRRSTAGIHTEVLYDVAGEKKPFDVVIDGKVVIQVKLIVKNPGSKHDKKAWKGRMKWIKEDIDKLSKISDIFVKRKVMFLFAGFHWEEDTKRYRTINKYAKNHGARLLVVSPGIVGEMPKTKFWLRNV